MKSFSLPSLFLLLSFWFLASTATAQYFEGSPQVIWGNPLTNADLTDKVVYIEYWGIHCGPCRAAFSHLIDCQAQYGPTGSFVLIGSHLQEMSPEVTEFLKQKNCNFTNYQQFTCPLARPEGPGIPQAYLLDSRGQVVEKGMPEEVLPKVGIYVQEALTRNRLINGFNPVLDVNVPQSLVKIAQKFTSEKPWSPIMKQLEKSSAKNEDAKTFLSEINSTIDSELETLKEMLAERPSEALFRVNRMMKSLKGLPQEKQAEKIIKKALKIEGTEEMQKAFTQMLASRQKLMSGKLSASAAGKEISKMVKTLKKVAEDEEFDETVRAEARALMEKMTQR